jgi:hypothetical protein
VFDDANLEALTKAKVDRGGRSYATRDNFDVFAVGSVFRNFDEQVQDHLFSMGKVVKPGFTASVARTLTEEHFKSKGHNLDDLVIPDSVTTANARPPPDEWTVRLTEADLPIWMDYLMKSTPDLVRPDGTPADVKDKQQWILQKKLIDLRNPTATIDDSVPEKVYSQLSAMRSYFDLESLMASQPALTARMANIIQQVESEGGDEDKFMAALMTEFGEPAPPKTIEGDSGVSIHGLGPGGSMTGTAKNGLKVTVTQSSQGYEPLPKDFKLDLSHRNPWAVTDADRKARKKFDRMQDELKAKRTRPSSSGSSTPSSDGSDPFRKSKPFQLPPSKNGAKSLSDLASQPKPSEADSKTQQSWSGYSIDEWSSLVGKEHSKVRSDSASIVTEKLKAAFKIGEFFQPRCEAFI